MTVLGILSICFLTLTFVALLIGLGICSFYLRALVHELRRRPVPPAIPSTCTDASKASHQDCRCRYGKPERKTATPPSPTQVAKPPTINWKDGY